MRRAGFAALPAVSRGFLLAIAVVVLAGGCERKDDTRVDVTAPPAVKADEPRTAAVSPPPPPAIDQPKGGEVQSPAPGQANDHSSPAFKGGGAPDKKK